MTYRLCGLFITFLVIVDLLSTNVLAAAVVIKQEKQKQQQLLLQKKKDNTKRAGRSFLQCLFPDTRRVYVNDDDYLEKDLLDTPCYLHMSTEPTISLTTTSTSTTPFMTSRQPEKKPSLLLKLPDDVLVHILSFALDDIYGLITVSKDAHISFLTAFRLLCTGSIPTEMLKQLNLYPVLDFNETHTFYNSICLRSARILCRNAFMFGAQLRVKLPTQNSDLLAVTDDYRSFFESRLWERVSTVGTVTYPFLVEAWQRHSFGILKAIDAFIEVRLLSRIDLYQFPGLMGRAMAYATALDCPNILHHMINFMEDTAVFNPLLVLPWHILQHLFIMAIQEDAYGCVVMIAKKFSKYSLARLRSWKERVPSASFFFGVILQALEANRPKVAEIILSLRLFSLFTNLEDSKTILKETIRRGPVSLLDHLRLPLMHCRFGLAIDAIKWNRIDVLQYLDRNGLLSDAATPLHYNGHFNVMHALAAYGTLEALEFLFSRRKAFDVDLNGMLFVVERERGWLPLHMAACRGDDGILCMFLARYTDSPADQSNARPFPIQELTRDSPLHLAALNGHFEAVKRLTWQFPRWLWTTGADEQTVLHDAVYSENLDVLRFLLDSMMHGEDQQGRVYLRSLLRTRNSDGQTAVMLARSMGRAEAVSLLQDAEAKAKWVLFYCPFDKNYCYHNDLVGSDHSF